MISEHSKQTQMLHWSIVLVSAICLYCGWRAFWFLCDDAFITFRYASNRHLGFGYVWNPPPFRPVEGYTSFLWLTILDFFWTVTGFEPPVTVNWTSLALTFASLLLAARMVLSIKLPAAYERWRPAFLALSLFGIVSNRTFLTWASSGLETALFNFLLMSWVWCLFVGLENRRIAGSFSLIMILLVLCRPDGMLFLAAGCSAYVIRAAVNKKPFTGLSWIVATLIPVGCFFYWRHSFYGELLPNTYYAKYSKPWPEIGSRYLASFIIEYALWYWLLVSVSALIFLVPRFIRWDFEKVRLFERLVACLSLIAHIAYYTLIIGGDHFEYRVYSYLIPLLFPSLVWAITKVCARPVQAILALTLFPLLSWPIPWIHWSITRNLNERAETFALRTAIEDYLPDSLRWYGRLFDSLQSETIVHFVGSRHQEHKIFGHHMLNNWIPLRDQGERIRYNPEDLPVYVDSCVGVSGWTLPGAAVIDIHGLNDYFTARNPDTQNHNQMAHDRLPLAGYVEAFRQNVFIENRKVKLRPRGMPLSTSEIISIEKNFSSILASRLNGPA